MSNATLAVVTAEESEAAPVTRPDSERIAVLETEVGHLKDTLARVVSLEAQVVRLAQAQEERNRLREQEHTDARESSRDLGMWLRWGVDRAVPLIALLLAAYIVVGGHGP